MNTNRQRRRSGFTQLELVVVIAILALLAAIILPAVQQVRETSRKTQCQDNLRGIGQAMQQYEGVHGRFPAMLGWEESLPLAPPGTGLPDQWLPPQAVLLPHLDQTPVFDNIRTAGITGMGGNPVEGVYEAARVTIPAFLCPSDGGGFGNNYRVCTGSTIKARNSNGAFSDIKGRRAAEIQDGLSNTAAASEAVKSDSDFDNYSREDYWMSSAVHLDPAPDTDAMIEICSSLSSPPAENGFYPYVGFTWGVSGYDHTWYNHTVTPNSEVPDCSKNGFQSLELANWRTSHHGVHKASSRHSGGVNVLYLDGHLRFESDSIDLSLWRALATRDGGEI